MYDAARVKGHVDICMKRYDGRTKPTPKPRINMKQKGKKVPVSIYFFFIPSGVSILSLHVLRKFVRLCERRLELQPRVGIKNNPLKKQFFKIYF